MGEFVMKTTNGDKLIYVFYHYDSNYIFAVPMKSTSDAAQMEAFNKVYDTFKRTGMTPKMHIVDNQCDARKRWSVVPTGTTRNASIQCSAKSHSDFQKSFH
jgi:hypothetical protein